MDWAATLAAARRSQAAYIEDPAQSKEAFEAMGLTWLGMYANDSHQAVLSRDASNVYLSISGTRFLSRLGDLLDDLFIQSIDLGGGCKVSSGVYTGLGAMWVWAKHLVPRGTVFHIDGHSLGAERGLVSCALLPANQIGQIWAFEAPKPANAAFWARYANVVSKATTTVNQTDVWYGWPFISEYEHPPYPAIWLQPTGYQMIMPSEWPRGYSMPKHDIGMVVSRIAAIAASEKVS
jgi:hypothetical protein